MPVGKLLKHLALGKEHADPIAARNANVCLTRLAPPNLPHSLQRLSPLLNPSSLFPYVIWDCRFYLATYCKRMPGNTYKDGRNIKRFL